MAGIRDKNTKPELLVRRVLHKAGYRFRLHDKKLPGKPDLVLRKYKTVIFVNGCFWHRHGCKSFKWPQSRGGFWRNKIEKNVARDCKNYSALGDLGWKVIVVWECELKNREINAEEFCI